MSVSQALVSRIESGCRRRRRLHLAVVAPSRPRAQDALTRSHHLRRLKAEIPSLDFQLQRRQAKAYKWQNGFLLRRILKGKYAAILEQYEQAQAERDALTEEIEKCRVALEIEIDGGIETTYGRLVEAFRALAGCEKTWDTTSEIAVDQVHARSKATANITRTVVTFDMKPADVIAPSRPAMHFQNANGGDLFILPGLLLVFGSHSDFGLIRLHEVRIDYTRMPVLETEGVPADSKVVGESWAKVNKDGSPDRRFANNRRIPIAEYGELAFKSASGLNERYLVSSALRAEAFGKAFSAHKATLPTA